MSRRYHFSTTIELTASRERVWEAMTDVAGWPTWWHWVRAVQVHDLGDQQGEQASFEVTTGSPLGYTLRYVVRVLEVQPPARAVLAARGDLEGEGECVLERLGGATVVHFTWVVRTARPWMRWLAPVAGPLFRRGHARLMADFAAGLARVCGGTLLGVTSTSKRPGDASFGELPGEGPTR